MTSGTSTTPEGVMYTSVPMISLSPRNGHGNRRSNFGSRTSGGENSEEEAYENSPLLESQSSAQGQAEVHLDETDNSSVDDDNQEDYGNNTTAATSSPKKPANLKTITFTVYYITNLAYILLCSLLYSSLRRKSRESAYSHQVVEYYTSQEEQKLQDLIKSSGVETLEELISSNATIAAALSHRFGFTAYLYKKLDTANDEYLTVMGKCGITFFLATVLWMIVMLFGKRTVGLLAKKK